MLRLNELKMGHWPVLLLSPIFLSLLVTRLHPLALATPEIQVTIQNKFLLHLKNVLIVRASVIDVQRA